ncbi:type IX secretion system membrane protein PorP/SprF [uncultured Pontibacter sp.]|uniref:PorP/SprF family type IX secretion system membrane protein n=1 Tax=uncultured Pontibacter sp. TaxID=453356 RepID=UPI00261A9344|nr:type IX secretion system membrane protein PorP/SprF [uncultured Pontibacter sp.]
MKLSYTLLLILVSSVAVYAQQLPQHTQYAQNNFLLNPAVAGIENYIDLRAGYRTQWVGLEGAPTSFYTSIHTSLNKNDRNAKPLSMRNPNNNPGLSPNKNNRFHARPHHGIGAVAQADRSGLLQTVSLNLNYAYHLPLTRTLNLSSGITAGLRQYRVNKKDLDLLIPDDPFLANDTEHMNKPDLGIGFWLYSRNFYIGLAGMQLLKSESGTTQGSLHAALQKHYYATGGFRVQASDMITVTPSVMVKMAESGLTMVDLNANLTYAQRFWIGAFYRYDDAVTGTVGAYLNHLLDVSYSYDITTSKLNKVSANSHEIVIGIKLNNKQKVLCPQWIW